VSHFSALSIIGTWSVQSMVRETGVGQRRHEFGSKPSGYISYLPDGRMHAILVADNRVHPAAPVPTRDEQARSFDTMIAYAGRYGVDGDCVVHDIEASWNELWTGSRQKRSFAFDRDNLAITAAAGASPRDGREGRSIVTLKKVR